MAGRQPPIAVYIGGDPYERQEQIRKVGDDWFAGAPYDVLTFDAGERETPRAIEELLSFSMLAENRVVALNRLEKIPKKKEEEEEEVADDDPSSKPHLERLVDYVKAPRGETPLLILVDKMGNLPAALKKSLTPKAIHTIKSSPNERQARIRQLVTERTTEAGVSIQKNAIEFISQRCEDDLSAVIRETEKVILYAEAGATITLDDCRALIDESPEEQIWPLMDAISARNAPKALDELNALIQQGKHPIYINTMISRQIRTLISAGLALKATRSESKALDRFRAPPWKKKAILRQARAYTLPALQNATRTLLDTDLDLKGGKPREFENLVIEDLVIRLCNIR